VLPAAQRGHRSDSSFEHLEQGLLDAKPQILTDTRTCPQFVDLVDAPSGDLKVTTGFLDQVIQNAFQVVTDVAGFGQGRGISDNQGNVHAASQGVDQVALARAGRSNEQDVGGRRCPECR